MLHVEITSNGVCILELDHVIGRKQRLSEIATLLLFLTSFLFLSHFFMSFLSLLGVLF